ncbi:MAG TPA: type II toxin-antitoxin system PemK/MazF family toxin [Bacilli bacterium]|nr:type II toxin-antitoxin system PemK/MazF family toxin [Bacilli bacterium]
MVEYIPNQKDIVFLDFNPTIGHEQKGKRPAIVLSNKGFNKYTKMCLVCPITSNMKEFPLHIPIKNTKKIKGVVMCEQIKTIDYIARNIEFVEKMDNDTYNEVIEILKSIIDYEN